MSPGNARKSGEPFLPVSAGGKELDGPGSCEGRRLRYLNKKRRFAAGDGCLPQRRRRRILQLSCGRGVNLNRCRMGPSVALSRTSRLRGSLLVNISPRGTNEAKLFAGFPKASGRILRQMQTTCLNRYVQLAPQGTLKMTNWGQNVLLPLSLC